MTLTLAEQECTLRQHLLNLTDHDNNRLIVTIEKTAETKTTGKYLVMFNKGNRETALQQIDQILCGSTAQAPTHLLPDYSKERFLHDPRQHAWRAGQSDFDADERQYAQKHFKTQESETRTPNTTEFNQPPNSTFKKKRTTYAGMVTPNPTEAPTQQTISQTSTTDPQIKNTIAHHGNLLKKLQQQIGELNAGHTNLQQGQNTLQQGQEKLERKLDIALADNSAKLDLLLAHMTAPPNNPGHTPPHHYSTASQAMDLEPYESPGTPPHGSGGRE